MVHHRRRENTVNVVDIDKLASLALFGGLPSEGLEALARRAQVVTYPRGAIVYVEGDRATDVFVVEQGAFDVVRRSTRGEHVLATLPAGEFFGEMSFVDMQTRAATVRAREDSVVLRWSFTTIHDLYVSEPKAFTLLVMNMARELSRRLRRADARIIAMSGADPSSGASGGIADE
jgi:CRP/FNR family cyclic AMP-dependent transcriptional regulator